MKICKYDAGHMTKMAAMPIYGKNLSNIFFTGNCGTISMKLGMYYLGLLPIIVCSYDDLEMTLTYFMQGQFWYFGLLYRKTVDISETVEASGLKIYRCRQLIQ